MKIIFKILLFTLMIPLVSKAETLLKLEDAIKIGLQNNYAIRISKNEVEITKVNNTAGNAGQNPSLSLNAGTNYGVNNTHQEYSNGNIINTSGATTQNYNAGLALNWTLFDGFKMFVTKQKLDEIQKLGEIKYRFQLQQSISQIILAYYDIVNQKQQLNTILEVKALSQERMKIGETRFTQGLSAKTELLQAKIDFNIQAQNEIQQLNAILQAKRKLNQIINDNNTLSFDVEDLVNFNEIDSSMAETKIIANNPAIASLQKQLEIAKLSIIEFESLGYPQINLNAGYGLNLLENSAGFIMFNRGVGPQIGASLSFPIYQGGNITRQVESSQLNYNSILLQIDSMKLQVITLFQNALFQYRTQLKLLKIEEETTKLSKENLYLAMERLKLAQTTSIEVRDAQLSYENSLTRLNSIRYNLKSSETQIKLLMGEL